MKKMLVILTAVSVALFLGGVAMAGEWHSGTNNLCSDCHTMHFSMQHNWDGTTPVPTTAAQNGNWLSATGPNNFLLKAPANQLCLSCHDGQSFAPDVFEANANVSPSQGRSAGALNESGATLYETFKGHTLASTTTPPGFNPAAIGAPAAWYDPTGGLECVSCHAQHGPPAAYRNLGPYALAGAAAAARPTYVINTTNDTTKDVWINIAAPYAPNTGGAAAFNPYYDSANVSYNRADAAVAGITTSNKMDTFCGACHADFHGGVDASTVQGAATASALDGFARHPTSGVTLGVAGTQGYGGHSSLARFVANTTKVKVYASDRTGYTDAAPGCVSCHKAHGNQNPFGLVFLNGNAASVDEQGGYKTGQTADLQQGYRNLCGQCHGQGN